MTNRRVDLSRPMRIAAVLFVVCFVVAIASCGRPYADASDASYAIAMSLVTISSRQMTDKLDDVDALIDTRLASEDLSEGEAGYLREIVEFGRNGDWEEAQRQARAVLSDQVER